MVRADVAQEILFLTTKHIGAQVNLHVEDNEIYIDKIVNPVKEALKEEMRELVREVIREELEVSLDNDSSMIYGRERSIAVELKLNDNSISSSSYSFE